MGRVDAGIRVRAAMPFLSVIIAATDSAEAVRDCLATLESDADDMEILVVIDPARIRADAIAGKSRVLEGKPGVNAHRLRRIGADRSRGAILAFTEDSCRLAPGWIEGWRSVFEHISTIVASGTVEPRWGSGDLDLAVFLCEYAPFLPGHSSGRLAGNNFAIRRTLLEKLDPDDIHESDVGSSTKGKFGLARSSVMHARRFSLREAIADRLRFGFGFGRLCGHRSGRARIALRVVLGPAILGSQLGRLAWTLLRKRRALPLLIEAGPLTAALLTAWSVGEWLGWLRGSWDRATVRPRYETRGRREA